MARPLHEIAKDVRTNWAKVNYAALPYLREMARLESVSDSDPDFGFPGAARSVVTGFLGNAATWRGDDARRVKAELKAMLKEAR